MGKKLWWAVKVNGQIESVLWGTKKEAQENSDISGLVEFGGFSLPLTIEMVPVKIVERKP